MKNEVIPHQGNNEGVDSQRCGTEVDDEPANGAKPLTDHNVQRMNEVCTGSED